MLVSIHIRSTTTTSATSTKNTTNIEVSFLRLNLRSFLRKAENGRITPSYFVDAGAQGRFRIYFEKSDKIVSPVLDHG